MGEKELRILVTEEDRNGNNILEMSNFIDGYISNRVRRVLDASTEEVPGTRTTDIAIIKEVLHHFDMVSKGECTFIPDFDSLPAEIRAKLKKGIYSIGESRQVEGNMRAVILDENNVRIKDITLKRVLSDPGTLDTLRNIENQMQFRQISEKLDTIRELQEYQIDRERDHTIREPFLNARDYILRAQESDDEEERTRNLEKANEALVSGSNAIYTDFDTASEHFLKITRYPIFYLKSKIENYIRYLGQDLQLLPKYVGVRVQLLDYLGNHECAVEVLERYNRTIRMLSEKKISRNGRSVLLLMHDYATYNETNRDCWYQMSKEIQSIKEIEAIPVEEVYLVSVEE